jgi:Domain of unknown function (DUF4340)
MQTRKTLLALLALVLIGGFAYYLSRQPEPQKNHKLLDLKPEDIAQIELRGPGRDLVIQRDGPSLWRIVKPVQSPADNSIADGIADAIANLQVNDTVETNPADLANFGLENPATTIIVMTKDMHVLPGILVGSQTPVGNGAYFKTSDNPAVFLTDAGFTVAAGRTLKELRSHVLVGLTGDQINRIAITHPDGTVMEIVRQGDGWMITKPRDYPADAAAVQQMIDAITSARVDEFVEDNPADLDKFGLAKPTLQFEVDGGKDAGKETVLIGFKQPDATKQNVYARVAEGNQPVATVPDYIVKAVNKSFDDLRDKTVLAFDQSNVGRITLLGGPVSILVQRGADNKWSVVAEGKTAPAKPEVADSLLEQLHDLKGTVIPEDPMTDPKPFGMGQPTFTAILADRSGKEIGSIYASEIQATLHSDDPTVKSPPSQHFGYATSTMDKAVYQITPDQVIDLENTGSQLKREVEPEPTPAPNSSPSASAIPPPAVSALPPPGGPALPPPGAPDLPTSDAGAPPSAGALPPPGANAMPPPGAKAPPPSP